MVEKSSVETCATNQLSIGVEEDHRCFHQNLKNMTNFNKNLIIRKGLGRSQGPKNCRKAATAASLDMTNNRAQTQIHGAAVNVE